MNQVKRILAPTDFSQASYKALETACWLAKAFGAGIDLLYVVAPVPALPADMNYGFHVPDYTDALHEAAEKRLDRVERERIDADLPSRRLVAYGDPALQIVETAEREGADLIVISTHGLTGWRHLVFGSVTEKVVRQACCPVLTVRGPSKTENSGREDSEASN